MGNLIIPLPPPKRHTYHLHACTQAHSVTWDTVFQASHIYLFSFVMNSALHIFLSWWSLRPASLPFIMIFTCRTRLTPQPNSGLLVGPFPHLAFSKRLMQRSLAPALRRSISCHQNWRLASEVSSGKCQSNCSSCSTWHHISAICNPDGCSWETY